MTTVGEQKLCNSDAIKFKSFSFQAVKVFSPNMMWDLEFEDIAIMPFMLIWLLV